MKNTNTIKIITYKVVGDFVICNKVSTCLILLCANREDANNKLRMVMQNKDEYIHTEMVGEPYIVAEEEDGTEWYYGFTD